MRADQNPEIFADELSGMMLGYPVSKLFFSSASQEGAAGEIAKSKVLTLSIPTQSLLSACKLILDHAIENQELIHSAASVSEESILKILSEINPPNPSGTVENKTRKKQAKST